MNKVVEKPVKIDLHIHSKISKHKDGNKVDYNTIENIGTLIEKLNLHEVNICAVTDHDMFDFELYRKLKEEEGRGSIQKVLPGVEFSVKYLTKTNNGEKESVLHVVTIFNDSDEGKIKKIAKILSSDNKKPNYDNEDSFSEKKFLDILKEIDLDTIMIVHQKESLKSTKSPREHDVNTLGEKKLKEFLFTEYFEAYEFRNKGKEVFQNVYIAENEVEELLRLITCSDCHAWEVYPKEEKNGGKDNFIFTWLKCLPTFRGVVMAITDHRRIKRNDSFFNPNQEWLKEINLKIKDNNISIPLSRGLNVIIGDNSIGKSLLLQELTNYKKIDERKLTKTIRTGYERHMQEHQYSIESKLKSEQVYMFDMQGEIRRNFEEHKLKGKDFLAKYFPSDIKTDNFKSIIDKEVELFCQSLENRIDLLNRAKALTTLDFNFEMTDSESIVLSNNLDTDNKLISKYETLISKIEKILLSINEVCEEDLANKDDVTYFSNVAENVKEIKEKYKQRKMQEIINNNVIDIVKTVFKDKQEEYNKIITDTQKMNTSFIENKEKIKKDIVYLVEKNKNVIDYTPNIKTTKILPISNPIYNYSFITKLKIDKIDNEYINKLIKSIFINKKGTTLASELIKAESIQSIIKNYPTDSTDIYSVIKDKAREIYEKDLKNINTINESEEQDKYKELSSGFNTKIYYDLISYDAQSPGIYIVDQPEDNISQKAIKEYVLDRFKTMSSNRQVIFVTHNPQFIVNLDVDNVIYIGKDGDVFVIQSGALEYEDKYDILSIVANNIDGGIETINRRWKRYEKNIGI